ncbi:MAG: PASTA domain-containing protein [Flavobacteriia bacterium]|nr:PASTA domain-containing protein [Flavobacteriia bacterium]
MELFKKIRSFIWSKHFLKHLGLVILAYIVIVTIVIFYLDSYTNHGQKIEVPNLVGKNVSNIKAIIEEKDLQYEILDSIYDPKKPEGTILEQDPLPTSKSLVYVKEGRIITLRVSKKTRLVEMPSLIDKSIRFAESVLENRGLECLIEYKPSSEADGAVLEQKYKGKNIKEGKRIPIGAKIVLVVGRNEGGEPVQIPNLYGLTISEAKQRLSEIPSLVFNLNCPDCNTSEDSTSARIEYQSPEYIEGVLSPAGTTVTVNATKNFVDDGNHNP